MRFPRQRVWPIFPGVRSFLNCHSRDQQSRELEFKAQEAQKESYLLRNINSSVWDVQIADYEDESGSHGGRFLIGREIG